MSQCSCSGHRPRYTLTPRRARGQAGTAPHDILQKGGMAWWLSRASS